MLVLIAACGALAAMGYAVAQVARLFGRRPRGPVLDVVFGVFVLFAGAGAIAVAAALTLALERCP